MSHGHAKPKQYGSRAPLGKVKIDDITDEVARLAAAEPGSPEYFDVFRDRAAALIREYRRLGPVPGSGTTAKQWRQKAREAARKLIDDAAKG